MMKLESGCVCCQKPCIFDACPYYRMEAYYCDKCRDDCAPAEYLYEGWYYCRECFEKELDNVFSGLSVEDKIEALMLEDEIRTV